MDIVSIFCKKYVKKPVFSRTLRWLAKVGSFVPLLAFVVTLLVTAPLALGEEEGEVGTMNNRFSSELGVTSRYLFRGLVQSDDAPAVQGALDYRWQTGAYAGVWASWVLGGEEADVEYNQYLGAVLELNGIVWNAGWLRYDYKNVPEDISRQEWFLIGHWYNVRFSYYLDRDDIPESYIELHTRWQAPFKGSGILAIGQQDYESGTLEAYTYYMVGWERVWVDQWALLLSYTSTSGLTEDSRYLAVGFKWILDLQPYDRVWSKY